MLAAAASDDARLVPGSNRFEYLAGFDGNKLRLGQGSFGKVLFVFDRSTCDVAALKYQSVSFASATSWRSPGRLPTRRRRMS